jgi:DNA-binding transcriptional ArsR family regulator
VAAAESNPSVDLDAALRALADKNRRAILDVVRHEPRAVGEIAAETQLSQQVVSHHLRTLRSARLVTEERQATRHLFVVRAEGMEVVQEFLAGFWPSRLEALKAAAERTARSRGTKGKEHRHG